MFVLCGGVTVGHSDPYMLLFYRNHFHLTGDVSFAIRQYMSMTQDRLWAQERGICDLIKEIAQFWYSKIQWNSTLKRYEIIGMLKGCHYDVI